MYSSLLKSFFSLPLSFREIYFLVSWKIPRSLVSSIIAHIYKHIQKSCILQKLSCLKLLSFKPLWCHFLFIHLLFLQWGQEERRTDNMEWFRSQGFSESISHVWSYLGSSHFPYQQGGWFNSSISNKSSGNRSNLPQFLSHLSPRSQADLWASPKMLRC